MYFTVVPLSDGASSPFAEVSTMRMLLGFGGSRTALILPCEETGRVVHIRWERRVPCASALYSVRGWRDVRHMSDGNEGPVGRAVGDGDGRRHHHRERIAGADPPARAERARRSAGAADPRGDERLRPPLLLRRGAGAA